MSSFLCFVCHSTVNADTNEDTREKYREVVGMSLCPDSHLCFICCHFVNKMWLFKSICLKRTLEYPVLFSEKGTINLQRSDMTVAILCPEDICLQHLNTRYHFYNNNENSQSDIDDNNYCHLQDERPFDGLQLPDNIEDFQTDDYIFSTKENAEDDLFTDDLILPNLEPVRISQDDLINDEWSKNDSRSDKKSKYDTVLLELNNFRGTDDNIPDFECTESQLESSINVEIDTNIYDNIENELKKVEEIDIDETIGNLNDNLDTNLNGNIEMEIQDDLDIITADINEIDPLSNPKIRNPYFAEILAQHTELVEESKKLKKGKKKDFEKIRLSVKEQKMELEQTRRDEKYLGASFKCHSCAMHFHFKDTYQAHMMRHEESNGEYRCPICSLRFANAAVLRTHAANHAERYQCTQCHEAVRARQRPTHLRICRGKVVNSVTCHLCGQAFTGTNRLQQHLQRFHKTKAGTRTYLCNVCGKNYDNRAAVRAHMITHINRKFACDQCSSTFNSPYTLNQHKKKHSITEPELHHCASCNISYTTRKSLLAHKRNSLAHKDSLFKCSICERACPSQSALSAHTAAVHERTRHLYCDMCPAKYSTKKTLVRHIATAHNANGPPQTPLCHSCGESFKNASILKRHLKKVCEKEKTEELTAAFFDS